MAEHKSKITPLNSVCILSISFMMYAAGSLIAPALNALQESFPDTPFPTIRMIMTSMYLSIFVISLLSGKLDAKISKKYLVVIGLGIYGTMGIIGANMTTVTGLLVCRILMGCGVGLVLPQATAIIAVLYDKTKKDKFLGFATGISNLGSMIGSIIGGVAAAVSWKYNFYCFGFAFVIMILVIIGVPPTPVPQRSLQTKREKISIPHNTWILALGIIMVQIYGLVTPTNMARFYLSEHLGPAGLLGITMALLTGSGFVAGFVLPWVRSIFKGATPLFACIITGIGFLILWKTTSVYTTMLAQVLIGFAVGILTPMIFIGNAKASSAKQMPVTNSIISASLYLGCFMTAYLQSWISQISGNSSQRFMFLVFGIGAFILTIILSIISKFKVREQSI